MTTARLEVGPPAEPQVSVDPDGAPLLDDVLVDDAPPVEESVVRALLRGMSAAVSEVAGDPDVEDHWRFTDRELDDLAPPLTRIINRRPQLRRAVARGDEAAVALVLAGYVGRNVSDLAMAKEARRVDVEREAGGPEGRARGMGGPGPGGAPAGPAAAGDRQPPAA